jgi:hypothetical protein
MRTVLKITAGLSPWTPLVFGLAAYVMAVLIAMSAHP